MPLWLKFYIVSDFLCSSFSNASIEYPLVKIANRRVSINFELEIFSIIIF